MNLKFIIFLILPLVFSHHMSAQIYDYKLVKVGFKYHNKIPGIYVIRSKPDWIYLWTNSISEKDPMPTPDFNKEIIIAVFRSVCPTAEYGINIHKISFVNKDLLVEIENSNPGENCRRSMDPTMPFAIYSIRKTSMVIYFKQSTKLKNCN